MKTIKTIASLALMLSCLSSMAQERGFFRTYPSDDNRFVRSEALETENHDYIIAINDDLYGYGYSGPAKLFKLSAEGELLNSVAVDDPDVFCVITNIFPHPFAPETYIGAGLSLFHGTEPSSHFTVPCLIHFDDELNITLMKRVDWPDELKNSNAYIPKFTFDKDWNLTGEYVLYTSNTSFRRFYATMSLDGELERIVEDSTDIQPTGCGPEAIFRYEKSRQLGTFRFGYVEPNNPNAGHIHKLFRLSDDFEPEEVNRLYRFGNDTIHHDTLGYIDIRYNILDSGGTTIIPLSDTSLLFSMMVDEHWYRYTIDSNLFVSDHSAVLFTTDTLGNMDQYTIVGSYNDSIEITPLQSIAVTKSDIMGHKDIYHCCYSQYDYSWEYPNTITITKFTDGFDVLWRKTYSDPEAYLEPQHLIATHDGGCLVIGSVTRGFNPPNYGDRNEWFALKLEADGTVGTNETGIEVRPYAFYPNPTTDVLILEYSPDVKPTSIELYDLQGRLVRSQRNGLESIDMGGLPAGTYTLRVTLEDGKAYTDKVVKE